MSAQERLGEARRATREGRHEFALQEFLWFHEHALEEDMALYGVRLSFALAYWVELGEVYPPAKLALIAARDAAADQLTAGNLKRDLFADISAINDHLDQSGATSDLFLVVLERSREFAQQCLRFALPALIGSGHFSVAREFIGEPEPALSKLAMDLNEELESLSSEEQPYRKMLRSAHIRNFVRQASLVLVVVQALEGSTASIRRAENAASQVENRAVRRLLKKLLAKNNPGIHQ